MADIVTMAASIDGFPTLAETDAMLDQLRRLPRTAETLSLIDELLELRSLLDTTRAGDPPAPDLERPAL